MSDWYAISDVDAVPTPALAVYPERIRENIRRMIAIAGGPAKLRTHAKTHKMAEVARLQLDAGITKFKCATLAEAEMLGRCDAPDVLLAFAPVGPNIKLFIRLIDAFRRTKFSALANDADAIRALSQALTAAGKTISVYLDVDNGLGRTGVAPDDDRATGLYRLLHESPGLRAGGLHVYDGQIREPELAARAAACDAAFAPVEALRAELGRQDLPVPNVIVGGTPTFPIHARRPGVECSPGTCLFSDAGYSERYADLGFLHAAVVLTRVVSKPGRGRITLDLGYKAISADTPPPRVRLFGLTDAQVAIQSEEFLTLETSRADEFRVGDLFYGVPLHICPTVALHAEAWVIENGRTAGRWRVAARDRMLTV